MPYEILNIVIPNAKYRRKRFTFQCRNFDLEIDLSRLHNYSYIYIYIYIYIYLFKVYRKWKLVVCRHFGI